MSKVAKWRACPVAAKDIRAAECGEGRHSAYQCPEDCRFNPFTKANYDQLLDTEMKVDAATLDLFRSQWQTRPWLLSKFNQALEADDDVAVSALVYTTVFLEQGATGKSLADEFIDRGMPGLRNDEEIIFQAKLGAEPVLLEVHEVVDDLFIKGIDLFHPERGQFLAADRTVAANATRFQVGFGAIYRLPHFRRFQGEMFTVGEFGELEPQQVMALALDHLGCPATGEERRRWLIENAAKIEKALVETALARNQRMMELTDTRMARARYAIVGEPDSVFDRLDARPDVDVDDTLTDEQEEAGFYDAWSWFETPIPEDDDVAESPLVLLGRVFVSDTEWRLECLQGANMPELKRRFESVAGDLAKFISEEQVDLAPDREPLKKDLVVPALVETARPLRLQTTRSRQLDAGETVAQRLAEVQMADHRDFLENQIPALGGLTPRKAAKSPAHRPTLIRLMKQRIRDLDQRNLETGRRDDINAIIKELGLNEIDFAPPPPRPIPAYLSEAGATVTENLPPAPRLPSEPLSEAEVAKRFDNIAKHYSSPDEHLSALARAGGTGPEDLDATIGKFLNRRELNIALMAITKASFVLVPPGRRFPSVDLGRVADELSRTIKEIRLQESGESRPLSNVARQPFLIAVLNEILLTNSKAGELRPESAIAIAAFLTAYINELDRQLRD